MTGLVAKDAIRACHLGIVDEKFSDVLNLRELLVSVELCKGKTDAQISETLGVSLATVKLHVRNVREKLGATNRTHAALILSAVQLAETRAGLEYRESQKKEGQKWVA